MAVESKKKLGRDDLAALLDEGLRVSPFGARKRLSGLAGLLQAVIFHVQAEQREILLFSGHVGVLRIFLGCVCACCVRV